jgi:hypothetical protein
MLPVATSGVAGRLAQVAAIPEEEFIEAGRRSVPV